MRTTALVVLFALLGLTSAEVIQYGLCEGENEIKNCDINEVRVKPCIEASDDQPCKIRKNHNAGVEFEFTPKVASESLKAMAFWTQENGVDLPFAGMNTTGCAFTSCPTVAGTKQAYSYRIKISKSYPAGFSKWNPSA